jgi:translocation and assembly module TamA
VSLGVGFSTNTGARAQATYDDLNVFGKRMKSSVLYEQKHQGAHRFLLADHLGRLQRQRRRRLRPRGRAGQITRTTSVSATRAWGTPLLERKPEAGSADRTDHDRRPTKRA